MTKIISTVAGTGCEGSNGVSRQATSTRLGGTYDVAVTASSLYFTEVGEIMLVSLSSGIISTVVTSSDFFHGIILDANIYFANVDVGATQKVIFRYRRSILRTIPR